MQGAKKSYGGIVCVMIIISIAILAGRGRAQSMEDIKINEIMYRPAGDDDKYEWIEIYNNDTVEVDINGWVLNGTIDGDTILNGTLKPGEYLIIAKNITAFQERYPEVSCRILKGNWSFLADPGDWVNLSTANGHLIHSVKYPGSFSENFSAERNASNEWEESIVNGGTPGNGNSVLNEYVYPGESIQDAIDNASDGDTIIVHDGTYSEKLVIDKELTLKAGSTPILDGGNTTYGPAVHITADNVTFEGFIIRNYISNYTNISDIGGILIEGNNAIVNDSIIYNIQSDSSNPAGIGIDIHANNVKVTNCTVYDVDSIGIRARHDWNNPPTTSNNITIENNEVYHTGNTGVLITGYAKGVKIINNEIYESLEEDVPYNLFIHYGAEDVLVEGNNVNNSYANIVLAGCNNITIKNNTIENATPLPSDNSIKGKNVYILNDYNEWYDVNATSTNVTIENNNISNAEGWGIYIRNVGAADPSDMASTALINYNNIYGNSIYGIENGIGTTVDAEYNYWGDATGPYHSSNPDGQGDNVSDDVDYSPWLGALPGTSPMTWHVNPTGTIQEAIDAASDGDTVKVHPGTYGPITINKEIKLIGDPNIDANGGIGIKIEANNTLVENITIYNGSIGICVHNDSFAIHNVTINNCTVHNCTIGMEVDNVTDSLLNATTIYNISSNGIYLHNYCQNITIRNNYIHNISTTSDYATGIWITSREKNITIKSNKIENVSSAMYAFGILQSEAGGIGNNMVNVSENVICFVSAPTSALGITINDDSHNVSVEGNVVFNITSMGRAVGIGTGGTAGTPSNVSICNNTIYNVIHTLFYNAIGIGVGDTAEKVFIEGNEIYNSGVGVGISTTGSEFEVINNTLYNNIVGIGGDTFNTLNISLNNITDNIYGIMVINGTGLEIWNNNIVGNATSVVGIWARYNLTGYISYNTLSMPNGIPNATCIAIGDNTTYKGASVDVLHNNINSVRTFGILIAYPESNGTIAYNTINGSGSFNRWKCGIGAGGGASAHVHNNTIYNIYSGTYPVRSAAIFINDFNASGNVGTNVTVEYNEIYDADYGIYIGWNYTGDDDTTDYSSPTIEYNTINNTFGGIKVNAGASPNILRNEITNSSYGIWIQDHFGVSTTGDRDIDYNIITKCNYSIYYVSDGGITFTINYNNIYDNKYYGLQYLEATLLNAEYNWWGDASGPGGAGPGSGDNVSNNVDYSPWLGSPWPTSPMTYHTNDNIQDAIDAASDGDTIKVEPGIYGPIVIDKPLKLIGDPSIDAHGGMGISIEANNTLVENMTIYNGSIGICVHNDSFAIHNVTINNCTIYNCTYSSGYGIEFDRVIDSFIYDSYINDTDYGIYLHNVSDYNNITNNHVYNNSYDGIYLFSSSNNTITNCYIYNNSYDGIYLDHSSNNTITSNYIYNNSRDGIFLYSSSNNNTIHNNSFSNNARWDLSVINSFDNTFVNNTFSSYPTKASLDYSGNFSVKGVDSPPADPAGFENIGAYLNITGNEWVFVYMYYNESNVTTNENALVIWKYNGSWYKEGWYDSRYLDTINNVVGVNITDFGSIFAPLQDVTPPTTLKDVGEPQHANGTWVTSHTPIWLNATDNANGSGLKATYYRIWNGSWHPNASDDEYCGNNNIIWNGTAWWYVYYNDTVNFGPIYFHEECTHHLMYYSVDNAGNNETMHNQTHFVDNSPLHHQAA